MMMLSAVRLSDIVWNLRPETRESASGNKLWISSQVFCSVTVYQFVHLLNEIVFWTLKSQQLQAEFIH